MYAEIHCDVLIYQTLQRFEASSIISNSIIDNFLEPVMKVGDKVIKET